ncbi:MAG: methyltransferase type 11 [Bacteroidetes bacterium GWE2_29_8]|nr:MAG: methyltransferase type 11 [Bacteroidetes bacterium GWE2_29_8]
MKIQDSGMPAENMWANFFEPQLILKKMGLNSNMNDIVDLGSGYGTFSIPAAKIIKGKVHAFDIDYGMISKTKEKIKEMGIANINIYLRDFIKKGTSLLPNTIDYVMLFNILHHNNPYQILNEVYKILKKDAIASIIHWRSDIETPRGPALDIRPNQQICKKWALESGFKIQKEMFLEPYHFGIIIKKI